MFAIAPLAPVDIQTIDVELPSAMLWGLIQLIYADELQSAPGDSSPRTIDDALILIEAAQKLEFDDVEKRLIDSVLVDAVEDKGNPLRA